MIYLPGTGIIDRTKTYEQHVEETLKTENISPDNARIAVAIELGIVGPGGDVIEVGSVWDTEEDIPFIPDED
tara:strand:+ start:2574 stop:2789 length:216 start_codon:yes stop_codon:yes gene_type:complete